MEQSKTILQSKNIWFNLLSVGAIVLAELQGSIELKEILGANAYWLMIIGAMINVLIRFYTDKPITIIKPKPKLNPIDEALRQDSDF